MVDEDDGPPLEARPAGVNDLVALCRSLNREEARHVVIGGMAIIQAGFVRATQDVDLLIEVSPDNLGRVRRALMDLPDRAVQDTTDGDLEQYVVVRVAGEIVEIPFANAKLLWRTKQTGQLLGPEAQS